MNEREIFQAALEVERASDRSRFLDQVCGNRPELRRQVEALLKYYDDAGSFLEHPPTEFEQTGVFEEQTTDEDTFFPARAGEDEKFSVKTLRRYLTPSQTPGVLGTLGPYEVLQIIGQGGMGVVLKAKDTKLHRIVAIKLLAPELASHPMARKRFLREAQAAAAVTHDHVVRIYAIDETAPLPMLVMEFIDGQSLQQKLDRTGTLETKEILRIGLQAALGLAAAHKQGLVHRDIKPANILLENGIQRVKISDFGLARTVDDIGMTRTGQITGTPQYMSPEQAQGVAVDSRSDLFSLGSVLYAMCTGRAAFRAESTMAVLRRVCDDDPRPIKDINPDIPTAMADVVETLMEKDPGRRIQSAEEVAEILSDHLAQLQQSGLSSLSAVPHPRRTDAAFGQASSTGLTWGKLLLLVGVIVMTVLGVSEATGVTRFAATIIRVATGEGTLMVEVDDPNVSVTIEGEDLIITGAGPNEVRLKPGQYRVTATKDGRPIEQELVTITRNGKKVVRISLTDRVAIGLSPMLAKARKIAKNGFRLTWTRDGKHLLSSQHGGVPIELHDLETGKTRPFLGISDVAPKLSDVRAPVDTAISPDGKTVALVLRPAGSWKDNASYLREEVWVVPFSGGPGRRIDDGGYPCFGADPNLLYYQDRKANVLRSIRLDDPEAKPRDVLPCPGIYPAISPDGGMVAFGLGNRLQIAELETGKILGTWTDPNKAYGMLVSWSPDSKRLSVCPYAGQEYLGFWCYDLETKQAARISEDPIGEAVWSPDGRQLAYTLFEGLRTIYLIDTDQVPGLSTKKDVPLSN